MMHPLLILSILLFGTSLASSPDTNEENKQLKEKLDIVVKKLNFLEEAFFSVHYARTFATGSEKLYTTNEKEGDLQRVNATCIEAKGRIPSPKKKEENAALQNTVKRNKKSAFLIVKEGQGYTNWAEGEPNTAGGTKNCVEIHENGKWHAAACEEKRLIVCEFSFRR